MNGVNTHDAAMLLLLLLWVDVTRGVLIDFFKTAHDVRGRGVLNLCFGGDVGVVGAIPMTSGVNGF